MGLRFGTLWFGNEPTLLQQISWNSYIFHGHELNIYLYDMSIKVPNGAIKKDANEIILEKDIFLPKFSNPLSGGGHGQFADAFRMYMLKKTDLIWTDSDMVCLSDNWPNPEPYLFGLFMEGPSATDEPPRINGDILYINNNKVIDEIITELGDFPIIYGENEIKTGPELLTKIILKNDLIKFAQKQNIFHPVNYADASYFAKPEHFKETKDRMSNSIAISLYYNSWIRHQILIPKTDDIPDKNTIIGLLTKKYISDILFR
jgi:hypothetical protein